MITLINLALAPVLIILAYIYIRDKYEKEPISLLILGVLFGIVITFPIVKTENIMEIFAPKDGGQMLDAFYIGFAVAGLVEEAFKFIILYFLILNNNNFNERFDGIVYAVFISLGFAGFENVMYVLHPDFGGAYTALSRAFVSVPSHALFGVTMGFNIALYKFERKKLYFIKAFLYPYLLHGFYDFILLSKKNALLVFFVALVAYMWVSGFKKMRVLIGQSPFKA